LFLVIKSLSDCSVSVLSSKTKRDLFKLFDDSEDVSANFFTFLLTLKDTLWNLGPKALPPPLL